MKNWLWMVAALATVGVVVAQAAQAPLNQETRDDIAKHRAISAAHEAAAKCLEAGRGDDVCEKELQNACKGLAIGKFCGMKH